MPKFTEAKFRNVASNLNDTQFLSGVVNESRKFTKTASVTSIFLSHSHTDKDKVEQAKIIFEKIGISVYVDWMDQTMPHQTSGETASKIKTKIDSNDKFIFLATNLALKSKWCNWEIGVADTFKFKHDKLAILPLTNSYGSWDGNEYLQLYPSIEYEDGTKKNTDDKLIEAGYYIYYPEDNNGSRIYKKLNSWLLK